MVETESIGERELKLYWSICPGLEPTTYRKLVRHFGSARAIHEASEESWLTVVKMRPQTMTRMNDWRKKISYLIPRVHAEFARKEISYIVFGDDEYPSTLCDLFDPPVVLFTRGDTSLLKDRPIISVVGTRRASSYGLEVAKWVSTSLGRAGYVVCSGMALGIDAASHTATLGIQGGTIAVLGSGVDICYPPSNRTLYRDIQQNGLLVSEYAPGTPVAKHRFPERNRMIAALGLATVVVQAGEKSGAILTAENAMEIGRDVYVVPGPITSKSFRGSHRLLVDGAIPLVDPEELLDSYGSKNMVLKRAQSAIPVHLQPFIEIMLEEGALRAGELAFASATPPAQVYAALLELEMSGIVERYSDGRYQVKKTPS